MKYYFDKTLSIPFDTAIDRATEELKKEGFGIMTEIDVKEALKKQLDVDFRRYRILGACNPPLLTRRYSSRIRSAPCSLQCYRPGIGRRQS